ncbi:helix-turn-helix domain-containing protein, partial [Nocardioides marinisabuli]|uniref:helix-turn-helix domain-containing protein n=1 Tax=Nocardioides marinisabuli TaxID=419476 RepID=UPI003D2F84D9
MAGGSPRVPAEWEYRFWDGVRAGVGVGQAAQRVGVSRTRALRWVYERGGVKPSPQAGARTRSLSFAEREQIAVLSAAGLGVRQIAGALGRAPSTISRELRRVPPARSGPTA